MFSLSTVCNTYCTNHQIINVFLEFSEHPPNEFPAWLAVSSLIPPVEVSVTTVEIDASVLAFLDVSSEVSCSKSDLRSIAFTYCVLSMSISYILSMWPYILALPLFIWIGASVELTMLIMVPRCRASTVSSRNLPSNFGCLSESIYANCWYLDCNVL